jgi:PAS domain S-box-containing protein
MVDGSRDLQRGTPTVVLSIGAGALLGSLLPLTATAVYLELVAGVWTFRNAWAAHVAHPLFWAIDLVPLVLAACAGVAARGWRLARWKETPEARLGFDVSSRIAGLALVVLDDAGRIVEWSPGAEDFFGYTAAEMLGQPLTRLIVAGDQRALELELQHARRGAETAERFMLSGQKADGRPVSLEISLATWPTRAGQQIGAVLRDVTKQVLAEQRLGENEKNWRDIAENSSDVLLLLDRAGTIVFANRGPLNKPLEQVIASSVAELIPELANAIEPALAAVFESGKSYQQEARITSADGQTSWWWCRFAPQREDGEVVRAVLSISDIGGRIQRDLALRRLAGILERTTDAVLTTDGDGRISSWNRGAELLWGWTEFDVIGKNVSMLTPPELIYELRANFARLREGRLVSPYDTYALAQNRRRIPVSVSITATRDETGQFEGITAVLRDMSRHQDLQDALEKAKSVAETANQLKSEFLANMSHEVRTPLNGVVGVVDLLRTTALTPEQQGYVATLLEAAQALRVIVDDVLDFSKIEAGQLRLENVEFDLVGLASAAVDMFRQAARHNDTELSLSLPNDPLPRLLGDPNRIRQVFTNLLNNAVKFTKNGRVEVRIAVRDEGDPIVAVHVEVRDNGVGISPEAQAMIFQPFAQGDGSITRRFGGTGLGLTICRKLMNLMGGDIGFESALGVGSTFWFALELAKADAVSSSRSNAPSSLLPKNSERWRILVAEDNAINQKVVSAMLEGLGCNVDIAENGRAAIELWEGGTHDLILMDCQMPTMSGLEAAAEIRERERGGNERIPIIAMTAQAYAQDRERCARAGMDDHLAKPLTKNELRSTLAKWLRLESSPPMPRTAPAPQSSALDTAMLDRLTAELGDDGQEMLAGLIDAFFVDFQQALERLGDHAAAARWERVAFEAHRLRSGAANLAAVELAQLCRQLEESSHNGDAGAAAARAGELEAEFVRVREALTAYARTQASRAAKEALAATTLTAETNGVPN